MIYKYKIEYGTNILELPANSNIMSTGITNGNLVVWVDVSEEHSYERYIINVVYTGEQVPYNCTLIGTVVDTRTLTRNSAIPVYDTIVYHVFESNL